MEIGLLTAFTGGVLALLSPCAALLLPAFFASTVGAGPRLIAHATVFYLGLVSLLVPLGLGVGALGSLVATQRTTIIGATAAILIGLGVLQLFGLGFDLSRALPGADRLQHDAARSGGFAKTFLLGASSGIAGFCAGPILGAVLTLALARGEAVSAGILLAVYGAGMVLPLFVLALTWNRLGARAHRVLRGRAFTIGGLRFHTTSVVTGCVLIAVGLLFWTTNGLVTMPHLVPTRAQSWLQAQAASVSGPWLDIAVVLLLAGLALALWWRTRPKTPVGPSEPVNHDAQATEEAEPARSRGRGATTTLLVLLIAGLLVLAGAIALMGGRDTGLDTTPRSVGASAPTAHLGGTDLPSEFAGRPAFDPGWDTPPFEADGVFIGLESGDEHLRFSAVDDEGTILWHADRPLTCTGFAVTRHEGRPLVVLTDQRTDSESFATTASAYDLRTGETEWGPVDVPGPLHGPGLVFAAHSADFIASEAQSRVALDPADGAVVADEREARRTSILGEFDGIVLTTRDGSLRAASGSDGATHWEEPWAEGTGSARARTLGDDLVLAGNLGSAFAVVSLRDGSLTAREVADAALDPDSGMLVTLGTEGLSGFDVDRRVRWQTATVAPDAEVLAAGQGRVWVREGETVRAFALDTGETVDGGSAVPVLLADGGSTVVEFESRYVLLGAAGPR